MGLAIPALKPSRYRLRMLAIVVDILLFLVVASTGVATNIVGLEDQPVAGIKEENHSGEAISGSRPRERRLLVNDELCTLYKVKIENDFMSPPDGETGSDEDEIEWHCKLDRKYATEVLGLEDPFVLLVGWSPEEPSNYAEGRLQNDRFQNDEADYNMFHKVKSGISTLKINQGVVDRLDQTLDIDSTMAEIVVHRRELQSDDEIIPKIGNKKVVVVRIATSNYAPSVTGSKIKESLFSDYVSLQRTSKECSYNKLRFKPFSGNTEKGLYIREGVVTVKLNAEQSVEIEQLIEDGVVIDNNPFLRNRVNRFARTAAENALGDLESQFDYVIFIHPRGIRGFMAVATLNRFDSYYTERWILRPSFPLHEVGHNLGMDHAGEDGIYDDQVGYMGFSYDDYNGPVMCYNPANSYYLGWYQQQVASYDAYDSGTGRLFTLNGVSDYNPKRAGGGLSKKLVVLRLTQSERDWDYYIGYNRKKGINDGTTENINQIVVVKKLGPANGTFRTVKVGAVSVTGEVFEIEEYNRDRSVYITFEKKKKFGKEVVIRVSTVLPSSSPTSMPTSSPTFNPTLMPTRNPTSQPTRNPTAIPTTSPTSNPTKRPTSQPTTKDGIYDRDDFRYKRKKTRNCEWVAEEPSTRCFLRSKKELVIDFWCRKTCLNVTQDPSCFGKNKDNFAYRGDPELNCNWVAKEPEQRCNRIWKRRIVSIDWCPESCEGFCGINDVRGKPPTKTSKSKRIKGKKLKTTKRVKRARRQAITI